MKVKLLILIVGCTLCKAAFAQKGNNELQVGAQLSIPTGQLSDLTKIGYDFSENPYS